MDMDENLQNIQIERYFNGTSFPKSTSSDSRGYHDKRRINRSTSGKTPSMYKISSQVIEIVSDIFWNTLTNSALIPKIRGLVSRSLR